MKGRLAREWERRWTGARLALSGRIHQYGEVMALRRFARAFAVDAWFDVGANLGQYATMLRKDVGHKGLIFSFEPNPDVFVQLERKAAGDPKWHVFNMALADFDGTASFNIMASHQFSSLGQPADGQDAVFAQRNVVTRSVEVQCARLDEMMPRLMSEYGFARPFLKMDTQGHDKSVCDGAEGVLTHMLGVQTEMAVRPIYAGATDFRGMITYLEERGFLLNAVVANNKGHFPLLVEMDGIFVNRAITSDAGSMSA